MFLAHESHFSESELRRPNWDLQHGGRGRVGAPQEELHAGRALREVGGAGRPQLQEPHHTGQFDTYPLLLLIILNTESSTRGNLALRSGNWNRGEGGTQIILKSLIG